MSSKFTYSAFGLIIQSELECPELIESKGFPDVYIKIGKTPNSIDNPITSGVRFQSKENEFLLVVDGVARYYITNGKSIIIEPLADVDIVDIRVFLLGSAFAAILHQRGLLPFHGSSIKIEDTAIIISGLSGAGKSTLAAAFREKGYDILADDISVVSVENNIPTVQPGYPQLKLWSDSIKGLGHNPENFEKVRLKLMKYKIPIKNSFYNQPLPLKKIYILSSSNLGELGVTKVKGVEKFGLLKTHIYRFNFVAGVDLNVTHFKTLDLLANTVDLYKLTRPSGSFKVEGLINLVLNG